MLQYHNITPAHFFADYDAGDLPAGHAGRGRNWRRWSATWTWRSAIRRTTAQELDALGFAPTGVMPIAVDLERITRAPRRPALEKVLGDGLINFLFVGRIAPNKKIEDHIRLAEHYKRYVDSHYRFIFVGRHDAVPSLLRHDPRPDGRSTRCRPIGSGSPARCPMPTWPRSTGTRASTSR